MTHPTLSPGELRRVVLAMGLSTALIGVVSVLSALAYPIIVPAVAFVFGLFLMPETRMNTIWTDDAAGPPTPGR